jgi:Asp-tRNA(Asn)/Glu-tRNA(Gln) amidotransferase A subunit family amidase
MPYRWTLERMAAAVRRKEIAPVELVEAHLARIERRNPEINAYVWVMADEARRRALELTGQEPAGPLHGIPVTIKDSFDVAGFPTYCGSRLRLEHRAAADSTAAARFRAAGAVLLGKTNCPEFLMNYETDNHITGRTNNPWNLARTPGGSSGGEAAAIAGRCSAGGVGSDGGGSIRVPAHFCGIAGLKPTPGRCPAVGHYPEICHPGGLLGVAGPMARTARDVRLLFEVLAGHDPQDPFSAPVAIRRPSLDGLRIGVMEQIGDIPVEPVLRDGVRAAAASLEASGFPVEQVRIAAAERAAALWGFFFKELPLTVLREFLNWHRDKLHWTGTELWDEVADLPQPAARDVLEKLVTRDRLRGQVLADMETHRVLLWPACGVTAFPHRQRHWELPEGALGYAEAMAPLTPANVLGLPAMVVPMTLTPDGLPAGVQLIGRPWDEELLLEVAERLEEARGPFPDPPE